MRFSCITCKAWTICISALKHNWLLSQPPNRLYADMWQWELPSWLQAQLLIWCIYTVYCLYSTCHVLAQLVTVHLEHKYIFHLCTYLKKVNIHTHADKQKTPARVLHTCLQFTLGRWYAALLYREEIRQMNIKRSKFFRYGVQGAGSKRTRELQSSEPQQMKDRCHISWHLSSHHLVGGLDKDNSHHHTGIPKSSAAFTTCLQI